MAAIWAIAGTAGNLRAEVITLRPIDDTTVVSDTFEKENTFKNWGGRNELFATHYPAGSISGSGDYILLRFDFSELPKNALIHTATLRLTSSFNSKIAAEWRATLKVWQISPENSLWVRGNASGSIDMGATGAYLDQTGYENSEAHEGQNWASGGLFNQSSGDTVEVVGELILPSGSQLDLTYEIDLDPQMLTSWLSSPELEKAGIAIGLTCDTRGVVWTKMYSTRGAQSEAHLPVLVLNYEIK